jgi:hypothetical protein
MNSIFYAVAKLYAYIYGSSGAGSLANIEALVRTFGVIGASAGSFFVFKGVYKAVLINSPTLA